MKPEIANKDATVSASGGRDGQTGDVQAPARPGRSKSRRRPKAARYARIGPRLERTELTLEVAAMEYIWLYDYRHGDSYAVIATRAKVAIDRVRFGVERAAKLDGKLSKDGLSEDIRPGRLVDIGFRLIPLFPIGSFTPQSACSHRESIGRGSRFCCMVCHASGMDDHPGLGRDPQTDPAPEPEPEPAPAVAGSKTSDGPRETRKQRRRRQFAEAAAVA
jgi:hypothetical protein